MSTDPAVLTAAIQAAYRRIAMRTPLPADCGALCRGACCKGTDRQGMFVFPGERELLERAGEFHFPRGEEPFVTCGGTCRRSRRPLACRIFPFLPVLKNGTVEVLPDPRGKLLCPLLEEAASPYWDQEFLAAVREAFLPFLDLPELRESLETLTRTYEDYARFF